MIEEKKIRELLRTKGKYLYHREGQMLEFKEQFNLAGLADYFRDFAAFANNRRGYLIFGVKDSLRIPIGLKPSSLEQFEKVDPGKILVCRSNTENLVCRNRGYHKPSHRAK